MDAHIPQSTPARHRRTRLVLAVATAAGVFAATGLAALQSSNPEPESRVEIARADSAVAGAAPSPTPFIDHSVVQSLNLTGEPDMVGASIAAYGP
jgi:hypothetical protein